MRMIVLLVSLMWSCASNNVDTEGESINLEKEEIKQEREVDFSMPEEVKIENKSMIIKDLINNKRFDELSKIYGNKARLIDKNGVAYDGISEIEKYWSIDSVEFVEQVIEEIVVKNGIAYEYGKYELGDDNKKRNYLNIWEFEMKSNQWKVSLDFRQ